MGFGSDERFLPPDWAERDAAIRGRIAMSDPELAARAQRAAVRLEQSWERWRRLRGLNTEKSQPISSYVGYSLVEPWGRPRVVCGVGAEEAEQLSALLENDERADPRYNQGLLWEPEIP